MSESKEYIVILSKPDGEVSIRRYAKERLLSILNGGGHRVFMSGESTMADPSVWASLRAPNGTAMLIIKGGEVVKPIAVKQITTYDIE